MNDFEDWFAAYRQYSLFKLGHYKFENEDALFIADKQIRTRLKEATAAVSPLVTETGGDAIQLQLILGKLEYASDHELDVLQAIVRLAKEKSSLAKPEKPSRPTTCNELMAAELVNTEGKAAEWTQSEWRENLPLNPGTGKQFSVGTIKATDTWQKCGPRRLQRDATIEAEAVDRRRRKNK